MSEAVVTKKLASSATVTGANIPGIFWGVCIKAGADEATVTIKDGGTDGADIFYAEAAANGFVAASPGAPLIGSTDLFATITGTSPVIYIYYQRLYA